MTREEIKEQAGSYAVWMASRAIMEACKALNREDAEGLDAATNVLFNLFHTYEASIKNALMTVAEKYDGRCGSYSTYFNAFISALFVNDGRIKLRESDWVLEA